MSKILVVDDSATMRKIVMKGVRAAAQALEKAEPDFVEAGDGVEALERIGKVEGIELILCDINMPNMDGIEFVGCVRDEKKLLEKKIGTKAILKRVGNSIPIIMVTTEGGLEKVQEALAAGANDYLKKPFTPQQLAEKIGSHLS